MWTRLLVRIGKSSHTTHHTQHIVVRRINTHRGARRHANRVVGHREEEGRVINARQVAGARGLVLLGLQGERVDVDAHRRHVGVVLVGLHLVEVATLADLEAVVAVELEQGRDRGVVARQALHAGHGVARLLDGAVPPVGVVEGLLAAPVVDHRVIARHERVTLHHPH